MKTFLLLSLCTMFFLQVTAQLKIGNNPTTINANSILELESNSKGLLIPRLSTTQRNNMVNPPQGLIIYNANVDSLQYRSASSWMNVAPSSVAATQLPNAVTGRNITSVPAYFTPFAAASSAIVSVSSNFLIPANANITLTVYSYDDDPLTFELVTVTPVNNSTTYTASSTVLATTNTAAYSGSGSATTGSFTYAATAGQLLTIKVTKTGGGSLVSSSGIYTSFTSN